MGKSMRSSYTETLADYISCSSRLALPPDVAVKTKLHILDTLAAIISGSRLKPGAFAARFVSELGGPPEAAILGTRHVTSVINAALANGMAAHADETDDSHLKARAHLGCAVVPAAWAVGERQKKSGHAVINAVALGYDVGARSTMALGYRSSKTQKHSTHSIATVFGAAAAAASLTDLDKQECIFVLSFTAQQASGIPSWNRDSEHIEKAFDFGGMGARNGVFAAQIVKAGATAVPDPLTGHHSFLHAFGENADPNVLIDDLGNRFEVMDASIKKWCVGSPIQAALDSLTSLMGEHGVTAADVKRMVVTMPDDRLHIVSNRDIPDICLQHLLAITLNDGTLTFASSHDEARMRDPAVLALRDRITVIPSEELTHAKPARQAIVALDLTDGRTVEKRTYAVRGTPDNPMTPEEVQAKAEELMALTVGAARAAEIVDTIMALEKVVNIAALRALLQAG
jgi:2-methylcitrate dehydratase PrpD